MRFIIATMTLLACTADTPMLQDSASTVSSDSALWSDTGVTVAEHANYESAETCAECHPVHYDEWRQSMHAYAAKKVPSSMPWPQKPYRDTSVKSEPSAQAVIHHLGEVEGENGALDASERSRFVPRRGQLRLLPHGGRARWSNRNNQLINLPGDLKLGPFADASDDEHPSLQSDFITLT